MICPDMRITNNKSLSECVSFGKSKLQPDPNTFKFGDSDTLDDEKLSPSELASFFVRSDTPGGIVRKIEVRL